MKRTNPLILIVDDEPKYVNALTAILKASGYQTISASNGNSAVELAAQDEPALILLDVRMPGLDGIEACYRIREFSRVSILMLTALGQKSDIVSGLEAGADDYLTKPFSTEELLARIRAGLRRAGYSGASSTEPPFQSSGLLIDYASRRVYVDGDEIHLTQTEYSLLCELTRAAGRVVSPKVILENVWGAEHAGENQLVQRVMNCLRSKLEPNAEQPRFILTRPGLGYMVEKPVQPKPTMNSSAL